MKTKMEIDTQCQWIGRRTGCGESAVPGKSYCEHHVWQVYRQGTAVHRRRDRRRADKILELESLLNEAVAELIDEGLDL